MAAPVSPDAPELPDRALPEVPVAVPRMAVLVDVRLSLALPVVPVGPETRRRLGMVESLDQLAELLAGLDPALPFPADAEGPRGRQGSAGRVVLPEGWLDEPDDTAVPLGAELEHSGG